MKSKKVKTIENGKLKTSLVLPVIKILKFWDSIPKGYTVVDISETEIIVKK